MLTQETLYRMALAQMEKISLRDAHMILQNLGSAAPLFLQDERALRVEENFTSRLVEVLLSEREGALKKAEKEAEFVEKHHIDVLISDDASYPYRLHDCVDAPLVLYSKGKVEMNVGKYLAVVGTRMPTERGKMLCRQLVLDLAEKLSDVTIVSGLAYGIDVTAHLAAIEAGLPTIIIPGHGLDVIYPSVHRNVAVKALDNGGILTEYASGVGPKPYHFIARNRIIAGLSDAVVVVESKKKGGSLMTAEMALSYGRDVFTFPGRVGDESSEGCNALIKKDKASLIENADDLIDAMMWERRETEPKQIELFQEMGEEKQQLMDLIRSAEDGIHVNSIVMETRRGYGETVGLLMEMEMDGLVKSLPGGMYMALK